MKSFYVCVDMGDVIYSLLFAKILGVDTLYLESNSSDVKFNSKSAEFLMPLIQNQEYIKKVELYTDQKYDSNYGLHPDDVPVVVGTDLTMYHASKFIDTTDKAISDIVQRTTWLTPPTKTKQDHLRQKKILINRTARYHGDPSFYTNFLRHVNPAYLLFVGLEAEHESFCREFNISMEFVKTDNALQLASIIDAIPTFVGNESLACAIATGLGKNCYVEYGRGAANYIFNRQNILYF